MQIDPSQLTGPHADDPSPQTTSHWDALEPMLAQATDGSHLMACPNCGMENGMPCAVCWNCEGPLTPQPSLRLVTRDGAEVAGGVAPDTRAPADVDPLRASLLTALGEHPVRDDAASAAVPAVQAQADARSWLPEWTTALDPEAHTAAPAAAPDTPGVNLRVIAGVVVAMLIAGAFGYYEVHSIGGTGSPSRSAGTDDAPPAAAGPDGGARRPPAEGAAAKTGQPASIEDALEAADRALRTPAAAADTAGAAEAPVAAPANDGVAAADVSEAALKKHAPAGAAAGTRSAAKSGPSRTAAPPTTATAPATPAAPPRPCSPTLAALGLCQSVSN